MGNIISNGIKSLGNHIESDIGDPIGDAIRAAGHGLNEVGDDFGDWVRGEVPEVPGGTLVTTWADTSKYPLIYGTRKTAGRIIHEYIEDIAGDPVNEILHQVVIYCEGGQHGIEGFEDHYFNEVAVSTGEFDGFYEAHPFTGAPGEILPQVMRDNLPQWTAAHTLDGLAGVYYRLRWKGGEGKQPFTHRPNYLSLVNGCKIQRFDEGTARFSTDPLEIIWDYLRAQRYGWNFPAAYLASVRSEWQAQSDFANQIVQSNGVDRALMTCNVFIDLNRNRKQILDILRQDFRIGLLPRLGETVPVIEKDQGVVRVFTEDNVRGPITERPTDITKRLNRVTLRWNDAAQNYKAAEYIYPEQVAHDALVVNDGGRILQKTITSHCIDNEAEAKQLAFVILNRSRHDQRLRIPIFSDDFDLEPTDLVQVSNSDLQIVNGIYEIKSVDLDKAQIEVIEHHPSDYPWQGYNNDNPNGGVVVPDLSKRWCDDVTGVALVANNHTPPSADDDLSTLTVTVTPPSDLNYSHAEVRYRLQDASAWQYSTTDANPSVNLVVTYAANAIFEVQVRSISQYELASEWIDAGTVNLQSTSGALPTINNLTLTEGLIFTGKDAHATWDTGTGVLPQHFNFFEVQITSTSNELLNTYTTTNPSFNYDFISNQNDGAGRTFKIKVRCISRTGAKGAQTSSIVSNPLPNLPTGAALTNGGDYITLGFNAPTHSDFKSIKVWVSDISGFTPIDGEQRATTTDNRITIDGLLANQAYYIIYSILDVFNADQDLGVLSGEINQHTAPNVLADVSAAVARSRTLNELNLINQLLAATKVVNSNKEIAQGREKISNLIADNSTQGAQIISLQQLDADRVLVMNALTLDNETQSSKITQLQTLDNEKILSLYELSIAKTNQLSLISQLQTVTADSVTVINSLSVSKGEQAAQILALQTVDSEHASAINQVGVTQAFDKAELQEDTATAIVTANTELTAATGYCSIGGHNTQAACEAASGVWVNEPLSLALLNAKLVLPSGEISAGTFFETLSNNGALKATAGFNVNVNGALAGVFIGANENSSDIVFMADSHKFYTSDGNKTPFIITNESKIEFDGEISIDGGRVAITDSVLDLSYHKFKMAINTVGLLHNTDAVGGIDVTSDGVAFSGISNGRSTAVLTNTASGGGNALTLNSDNTGLAIYSDYVGVTIQNTQQFMLVMDTTLTTFPAGIVLNGGWFFLADRDGIWVRNGASAYSTNWKNIITGAVKAGGAPTNTSGGTSNYDPYGPNQ